MPMIIFIAMAIVLYLDKLYSDYCDKGVQDETRN